MQSFFINPCRNVCLRAHVPMSIYPCATTTTMQNLGVQILMAYLVYNNMFVQNTIKLLWQIRKQCYEVSFAIMNIYLHKNINIKSSLSGISGPSQRSEIWSPMRATTSLASLAAYSCWAVFAMFQNLILMAYLDVPILMATLYVLNPKGFF